MNYGNPTDEAAMIDREVLKRAPSAGHRLKKAALRNQKACSSHVPAPFSLACQPCLACSKGA
jgi:hypothetical protein